MNHEHNICISKILCTNMDWTLTELNLLNIKLFNKCSDKINLNVICYWFFKFYGNNKKNKIYVKFL
jgi:hypothetical protein